MEPTRNTYIIWNQGGLVHEIPRYRLWDLYGRLPDEVDFEIRMDGAAFGEVMGTEYAGEQVAILDHYPDTEEVVALLNDTWPEDE